MFTTCLVQVWFEENQTCVMNILLCHSNLNHIKVVLTCQTKNFKAMPLFPVVLLETILWTICVCLSFLQTCREFCNCHKIKNVTTGLHASTINVKICFIRLGWRGHVNSVIVLIILKNYYLYFIEINYYLRWVFLQARFCIK
jgi:hypothetical protein